MQATPFDARFEHFSNIHWLMYYDAIQKQETERFEILQKMLVHLFGIEIKDKRIVPLAYLINGEMMHKMLKEDEIEVFGEDHLRMSDEESLQALQTHQELIK